MHSFYTTSYCLAADLIEDGVTSWTESTISGPLWPWTGSKKLVHVGYVVNWYTPLPRSGMMQGISIRSVLSYLLGTNIMNGKTWMDGCHDVNILYYCKNLLQAHVGIV